jgi:hypothetical protein
MRNKPKRLQAPNSRKLQWAIWLCGGAAVQASKNQSEDEEQLHVKKHTQYAITWKSRTKHTTGRMNWANTAERDRREYKYRLENMAPN